MPPPGFSCTGKSPPAGLPSGLPLGDGGVPPALSGECCGPALRLLLDITVSSFSAVLSRALPARGLTKCELEGHDAVITVPVLPSGGDGSLLGLIRPGSRFAVHALAPLGRMRPLQAPSFGLSTGPPLADMTRLGPHRAAASPGTRLSGAPSPAALISAPCVVLANSAQSIC